MTRTCRRTLRHGYSVTSGVVAHNGRVIELPPLRAKLLAMLAAQDFVTREAMMKAGVTSSGSLQVHVTNIRRVLPLGHRLDNEHGRGYRLVAGD